MEELLEQEIKEFRQVILTINSIPNPSEEEKRLKDLAQRKLEELDEAKNFFKPISSDIHKQIKIQCFIIQKRILK